MLAEAAERIAVLEAENRALRAALAEETAHAAQRKGGEDACRRLAASVAVLAGHVRRDGAPAPELQAALNALRAEAQSLGAAIARPSRGDAEQLRRILASATGYAIYTSDLSGRITSWNTGAQRIFGYTAAEVLGRPLEILFTAEDRAARIPELGMCRAVEEGRAEADRWLLRKDGSRFWAEGTKMPLLDAGGGLQGFLRILRDRTGARAEEERRALLLREMSHRIKNTLAVVHSMAVQTERTAKTPTAFRRAFGERLRALSQAHDMLASNGWDGAPLREVVRQTLEPHVGEGGAERVAIDGPPVRLPPHAAVTVHLAFHELATNAAKHGSLSAPDGRVEVAWSLERGTRRRPPMAEILWREHGGPPVQSPDRAGFGLRLLRRGLAREFGAAVGLSFMPEGVECRIRLALAAPAAATGART